MWPKAVEPASSGLPHSQIGLTTDGVTLARVGGTGFPILTYTEMCCASKTYTIQYFKDLIHIDTIYSISLTSKYTSFPYYTFSFESLSTQKACKPVASQQCQGGSVPAETCA